MPAVGIARVLHSCLNPCWWTSILGAAGGDRPGPTFWITMASEDEGNVLCVLVTCSEGGGEHVLLSRYFDGSDASARVWSP